MLSTRRALAAAAALIAVMVGALPAAAATPQTTATVHANDNAQWG
ncbi:hypothetical protein ABZY31_07780 [Streptomyces sp. NPDC006529]